MSKERTSQHFLKYADNFKSYKTGEVIFKEGDPCVLMFVVKEGKIELRVKGVLLEVVESGNLFGEMALIEGSARSATAVAASDCKVVPVDQEKFTFLVQQTPYFALEVLKIMARRLRATSNELTRVSGIYKINKD